MKRVIVHPSFINASFGEAENCLQSMDQGDAVFRPSSKVRLGKNVIHSPIDSDVPLNENFSAKFFSQRSILARILLSNKHVG